MLEKAMDVLRKYPLCNRCLGRLFARLGYSLTNEERGRAIKDYIHMMLHESLSVGDSRTLEDLERLAVSGHVPSIEALRSRGIIVNPQSCYICEGLFNKLEDMVKAALDAVTSLGADFETLAVGSKVPLDVLRRELIITTEFNINTAESIKRELNREIGKRLSMILGKAFNRSNPDIVVIVDPMRISASVELMPIYILTRYRKLIRGLSQAQPSPRAIASILKLISELGRKLGASDVVLHAAGREDIDVRMLGNGRPVVIQIIKPLRRPLRELKGILASVGEGIINLDPNAKLVSKSTLIEVKSSSQVKIYRVLVGFHGKVSPESLESLSNYFRNRQITQYTPSRIRRRPLRRRVRIVYELRGRLVSPNVAEFLIKCQGGLYVKEFVHGDGGRTEPSIAGTLGVGAIPIELDVMDIED